MIQIRLESGRYLFIGGGPAGDLVVWNFLKGTGTSRELPQKVLKYTLLSNLKFIHTTIYDTFLNTENRQFFKFSNYVTIFKSSYSNKYSFIDIFIIESLKTL